MSSAVVPAEVVQLLNHNLCGEEIQDCGDLVLSAVPIPHEAVKELAL